jgi:acyl-CoA synthetase (AMP-forming)/AMP-acid ligase II
MPPARILEWLDRGPKVPFFVMYGATEASARLTYLPPSELPRKLGSIGISIPNTEVRVMKDDGTEAAPGEVGELLARGNNIACGYWNCPDETREKFGPQGYRTGDLGYVDGDGFIFLVGRRHDMIKVGANRIGPKEIEDVLYEYPGVHEAAVIGVPHEILGEVPVAILSMRSAVSPRAADLRAFCRTRGLPLYKIPVDVIFRPELPKLGSTGKIDKLALRELVGVQASRAGARTRDDRDRSTRAG